MTDLKKNVKASLEILLGLFVVVFFTFLHLT